MTKGHNEFPNLMEGYQPSQATIANRSDPAYEAAMADVREWVYIYLLAKANDARAQATAAKEAGQDRKFMYLIGVAGAYNSAAQDILIDQHFNPEIIAGDGPR